MRVYSGNAVKWLLPGKDPLENVTAGPSPSLSATACQELLQSSDQGKEKEEGREDGGGEGERRKKEREKEREEEEKRKTEKSQGLTEYYKDSSRRKGFYMQDAMCIIKTKHAAITLV